MKIGIIGTGHMGEPIMAGIASKMFDQVEILIHNRNEDHSAESVRVAKAASEGRVSIDVAESDGSLCMKSDVIIIGVRPQAMDSLMDEIAGSCQRGQLIISLAAGIKLDYYQEHFGKESKVVLAMPNQPARFDMGVTSLCRNENVDDEQMKLAGQIFETVGQVLEIDVDDVDCFTGIASSTAFIHYYIGALVEGAVANGMPEAKARMAVAQAAKGGAEMILRSDTDIDQIIASSTTEGGTTIEGINVLRDRAMGDIMKEALQASIDRAAELGAK